MDEVTIGSREYIELVVLGHCPGAMLDTMEIQRRFEGGTEQIDVRVRRKPDAQTVEIAIVSIPKKGK